MIDPPPTKTNAVRRSPGGVARAATHHVQHADRNPARDRAPVPADRITATLSVGELREIFRAELAELELSTPPRALLTRAELAEQLACCDRTIMRLEREGLPRVQLGDSPRYRLEHVLSWLEQRSAAGSEAAE